MAEKTFDLRGLKCPLPVLRTRKALAGMQPGDILIVACTDPLAGIDIPNLLRETGDTLEHTQARRECHDISDSQGMTRRARQPPMPPPAPATSISSAGAPISSLLLAGRVAMQIGAHVISFEHDAIGPERHLARRIHYLAGGDME